MCAKRTFARPVRHANDCNLSNTHVCRSNRANSSMHCAFCFLPISPICSGGHNNGCGTGGAHPDNGWYGFQKDSDYNDLGAGGEGGGNKAWHRWGIPGKVIQGGTIFLVLSSRRPLYSTKLLLRMNFKPPVVATQIALHPHQRFSLAEVCMRMYCSAFINYN